MGLFSFIANFGSSGLAPALEILEYQLLPPQPISKLSYLVAVCVLMQGCSNVFWVPLANAFGRRPILILSMLMGVFFSVWCGLADGFGSLLAARALQGVAFAPADTIAPDVIGEIFFVHQRGRALAIYTLFLAGGSFVGGIAGAYIAGDLGYRYFFWICTALFGFNLLCEVFLVPETLFDRQSHLVQEQHPSVTGDGSFNDKANVDKIELAAGNNSNTSAGPSLWTFAYRGHLLQHFLDPWRSLAFPGTWVVMLHYGGLLGGLVTISTVGPQFLAAPPYLWGNDVGLLGFGGFIGSLLGGVATYVTTDLLVKRLAKKESHGLAEPESRLPAMFPALFLSTMGILIFGLSAANPSPHAWAGMAVAYGMVGFGITQIPSIGLSYLIDSYNAISADCFVMTAIARSVVSFAWTFFVTQWIETSGAALPFGIFTLIMGLFALLTFPLWLFGKRMRIATAGYLPTHANH
ncbi:hypothetical protein LTR36_005947 [Oleoguttula mirabilis]|uniref:Major facilitator superfamily (MFS) profile domain-containing protein n=1 Tax=Oleoguttula mirabilis TaxID=1507867 RepID=A0AAV9JDL7_9PEZI|nr:hypothetical protein LTR36_005947 [Oleoguttula mirabilis]